MSRAGPDSRITGGAIDFPSVEYPEPELEPVTLLDLVYAVVDSASSDEEAAATILHLLGSASSEQSPSCSTSSSRDTVATPI